MHIFNSLFYLGFFLKLTVSSTTELPNSCIGKKDGSQWVKLMNDDDIKDYPPIHAKCSNEYLILDYNYDNNLKEYFSTWNYWHYAIVGPDNGDIVNWEQWYLPTDENTKFLVSSDCTTCDETTTLQYFETKTTYWMTGNIFGCWWPVRGYALCDLDLNTYACQYCGSELFSGDINPIEINENSPYEYYSSTGQCATSIQSSTKLVPQNHEDCTSENDELAMKPSLGVDGRFCVCVKPSENKQYNVDDNILSNYQTQLSKSKETINKDILTSSNHVVELYAKDFEYGTYRITKAGTYKIMEDIEFEFNKGDYNDPFLEGSWWPSSEQSNEYPGAADYRDPYFLGFFAGITVETSDVVIDLNGHTLKMSDYYYYYQRWFSIIELASQYFLPGQGPGFMGYDPKYGSNIVIKNGVLGLSSHFGIHGNFNNDVQILNVQIRDFEIHGMQLNGWSDIVLSNVDIGPSSTQAYLKSEFGHARVILPRLRKIYDENPTGKIHFANRDAMTMKDVADTLETQMKLALQWAITKEEPSFNDEEEKIQWEAAKKLFINENGIPFSAALVGLFLNLHSTSLFTLNLDKDDYSSNAKIENVKIHDLTHSFQETIRLSDGAEIYVNPLSAPMDALAMIGEDKFNYYKNILNNDFSQATYQGHALTDAYIAMNKLTDNWDYLGDMMIKNDITVKWSENKASFYENWSFGCNSDIMLHSGKGILGFRMDGIENAFIDGLQIYNIYDLTPLGKTECGEYETFIPEETNRESGGHVKQFKPIQDGFSGNMVLGVSIVSSKNIVFKDVDVHNLESETGLVHGIAVWTHCNDISFRDSLSLYNLNAGSQVELNTLSYFDRPNKAPEACALKIQWETKQNDNIIEDFTTKDIYYNDVDNWKICNIKGHVSCDGTSMNNAQFTTESDITYDETLCSNVDITNHNQYHKSIKIKSKNNQHIISSTTIIYGVVVITVFVIVVLLLWKKQQKDKYYNLNYKYSKIDECNPIKYGSTENAQNSQIIL